MRETFLVIGTLATLFFASITVSFCVKEIRKKKNKLSPLEPIVRKFKKQKELHNQEQEICLN